MRWPLIRRRTHERILWSLRQELHVLDNQLADAIADNSRLKLMLGERNGQFLKLVAVNDRKQ